MNRKKVHRMTYEDRMKIEEMLRAGKSIIQISEKIGVSRNAIYHELHRNQMTRISYSAHEAQLNTR